MLRMPSDEILLIVDTKGYRFVPASVSSWLNKNPVIESLLSQTDKCTHHSLLLPEACYPFDRRSLSVPARKGRLQTVFLFPLHRRSDAHKNNKAVPHISEPVPPVQGHLSQTQNRHALSGCPGKYAAPDYCTRLLCNEVP